MRKITLKNGTLTLTHTKIDGFLERTITQLGTSGKADCPKKYIGKKAYLIICKN